MKMEMEKAFVNSLWANWGLDHKDSFETILETVSLPEEERVHPLLRGLIGRWPVDPRQYYPTWWSDFIRAVEITTANMTREVEEPFIHAAVELKKSLTALKEATPAQSWAGLDGDGKRFLKRLKKALEKMNVDATTFPWWRTAEVGLSTQADNLELVGSKTAYAVLGMSSYTGNKWSSCQCFATAGWEYARRCWANLVDPCSLVMYVTSGEQVHFRGHMGAEKHEIMLTRTIVRVLKDEQGRYYIIPDRSYPDDRYLLSLLNVLREHVDALRKQGVNVVVGVFDSYNITQNIRHSAKFGYGRAMDAAYPETAPLLFAETIGSAETAGTSAVLVTIVVLLIASAEGCVVGMRMDLSVTPARISFPVRACTETVRSARTVQTSVRGRTKNLLLLTRTTVVLSLRMIGSFLMRQSVGCSG